MRKHVRLVKLTSLLFNMERMCEKTINPATDDSRDRRETGSCISLFSSRFRPLAYLEGISVACALKNIQLWAVLTALSRRLRTEKVAVR